jgi:serine-type D-Ala-D-Ala carboxypeptidase/endopeptidase
MTTIVEPTQQQLDALVSPYLEVQQTGLAFVIGYASPNFSPNWALYCNGNIANQRNRSLPLGGSTLFELASVSKTFTATLYALLAQNNQSLTLGDFMAGNGGPLHIGSQFANIPLSSLVSYTSGLPADNLIARAMPAELPQPYSTAGMLGFLAMTAMAPIKTGQRYTYSNLGFAVMATVLRYLGGGSASYEELVQQSIFSPLSMNAAFFGEVFIDRLAIGYNYSSPDSFSATAPGWPLFPAYHGAGGIVASPNDMVQWLLFNMGLLQDADLTPLLATVQSPATPVKAWGTTQLGLGWFITPGANGAATTLWKDGELQGTNSYIAFLQSPDPGGTASEAGVFVLTNASGIVDGNDNEIVATIANDVLLIMQGITPPEDKSVYPRSIGSGALR